MMTMEEIKNKIKNDKSYSFLNDNEHLGKNICMLGLGGSYAYGTNIDTSDIDIRGFAVSSKEEILTNQNFEQVCNTDTDTTIYSFNKLISLLSNCNPNTIEILGLKPEHYIYLNNIGKILLANKDLFLSKKAVYSFGGYANQQLQRLNNKAVRKVSQSEQEQHILKTIEHASVNYSEKYFPIDKDNGDYINLYIDKAVNEEYVTEIFMDINLHHYPLRDYKSMWSEMHNIVKSYNKIGSRNNKAAENGKLSKHMMHLIRLYLMCLDILENKEIVTYREKEHDFLMDIRNGKYLDSNDQPTSEFFDIVNNFEKKLDYAKNNTDLPEHPNYKKINELMIYVNESIVNGYIDNII